MFVATRLQPRGHLGEFAVGVDIESEKGERGGGVGKRSLRLGPSSARPYVHERGPGRRFLVATGPLPHKVHAELLVRRRLAAVRRVVREAALRGRRRGRRRATGPGLALHLHERVLLVLQPLLLLLPFVLFALLLLMLVL